MEEHGENSTALATIPTGGSGGNSDEEHFNLLLQIQQLQDKCTYLAGGTDGEQLTDVLMEKEEECRGKDRAILSLEEEMNHLSDVIGRMEQEKAALQGLVHEQGVTITGLTQQVRRHTFLLPSFHSFLPLSYLYRPLPKLDTFFIPIILPPSLPPSGSNPNQ
jgi:hypothetical protein